MTKDKTVRMKTNDEVEFTKEYVAPPDASHMTCPKQDEPFHTIDMKQEDRFFYEKDDSSSSPHHSWSSAQTISEPDNFNYMPTQNTQEDEKQVEEEQQELVQPFSDDDDEFDWNDDPDKPKRRPTARQRLQSAMSSTKQCYCCWHYLSPIMKRVIIALLGSMVFIGVGVIVYFTLPEPTQQERDDPNFKNIRSNVQCWLYWSAIMWHLFWMTTFLFDLVPPIVSLWTKKFKGARSEKMKSKMEYYLRLKTYFCLFLLSIWNLGCWLFLINHPFESIKRHSYSEIVTRAFGCLIVAAALYFGQKAIIQVIAIRFHRTAYKDRLIENKKSLKFLDALSKSENRKSSRPTSSNPTRQPLKTPFTSFYGANGKKQAEEEWDSKNISEQKKPNGFNKFQKKISRIVLAEKPTSSIGRPKADINSDDYAKKVARKLFYALAHPPHQQHYAVEVEKKHLDIHSFTPYFVSRDEAEEAFFIFDKDGNRNLTRREFRDTIIQIYRDRKSLAQSMRDTSQALGKIDNTLLVIQLLATTFISLAIFQVDFWAALVPFGTLLAACTFVFDSSARQLCQGILFQFVTHPYDAGDMVMIDGSYLTVENIGLLGTVFEAAEGDKVYAPTDVLITKLIHNVRRSGNMGEVITLNIDFRTDNSHIMTLKERMSEWVSEQTRDFAEGFDLRVTDIIDMNQVILTMWLPHKGNWVELGKRFQRKTRFMLAMKSILTDLDIRYELPAQKFTSDNGKRNPFENL